MVGKILGRENDFVEIIRDFEVLKINQSLDSTQWNVFMLVEFEVFPEICLRIFGKETLRLLLLIIFILRCCRV